MRINKYAESKYCKLTHKRFKCFFTLIDQGDYKEAHSVSFENLAFTKFSSQKLTENSARTLGEILLKIADELKQTGENYPF